MHITFKLYANLTQYLPHEHRSGNLMRLEVPTGASIAQVIAPFHLPMHQVKLALVNGHYVPAEAYATRSLADGDVLAIWPPIAGG
jgi:sulfur carrier protein ThiS